MLALLGSVCLTSVNLALDIRIEGVRCGESGEATAPDHLNANLNKSVIFIRFICRQGWRLSNAFRQHWSCWQATGRMSTSSNAHGV